MTRPVYGNNLGPENIYSLSNTSKCATKVSRVNQVAGAVIAAQPSPFLNLLPELKKHVLSFLSFQDLITFGLVNSEGRDLTPIFIVQKARRSGYQGSSFVEAKEYIKKIIDEINLLACKNILPQEFSSRNVGVETLVKSLESTHVEDIYTVCEKLQSRLLPRIPLLTKYFLKLVNDNPTQTTQIVPRDGDNEPLKLAAAHGAKDIVELLLAIGADPNPPAVSGSLPLHLAAEGGFDEVVSLLLEGGAHINDLDGYGQAVLCPAISGGYKRIFQKPEGEIRELVRLLLDRGADPNTPSADRTLPLHLAAVEGFAEIVSLLLERGARINDLGKDGKTALHFAVRGKFPRRFESEVKIRGKIEETVRLLLTQGADPNIGGLGDVVELLLTTGENSLREASMRLWIPYLTMDPSSLRSEFSAASMGPLTA